MMRKYGSAKCPGMPKIKRTPWAFSACNEDSVRFTLARLEVGYPA